MPRVLDSAVKIVFCEGRPGSLDDLLLGHLLPVGQVLIQPVGGKQGMRAFIEGHLGSYGTGAQPTYLGFRDRDFDSEPPAPPRLIPLSGAKPIWLSHRAAIENYFIDADLILRYWTERENAPGWQHGPAPSRDEIESHIRESARELVDYQAVRWGLARLKPGPRWPEIRTTWMEHSGDIPPSLTYNDCLEQACQLVSSFQSQIQDVHPDRLYGYAQEYLDQFSAPAFLHDRGYLIWFHGKDHLTQLRPHLAPNFSQRHYANWAAEHVNVAIHPDLQELVSRVTNLDSQQEQTP